MFVNKSKYQSIYGEIKHSYAYEKFYFKGQTKGIALKYVKKGYENYLVNDQAINLQKGQFILVGEDQHFEAQAQLKTQEICGLCIDLNTTTLNTDKDKIYSNPVLFNLPFDCFHFSPLVKKLDSILCDENHEAQEQEKHILEILNTLVHEFADDLLTLNERLAIQTKKTNSQRAILNKLISSKNYIYANFNQTIKLNQLAQKAGISKFHFLRLFKLVFDKTPLELREELRMQKAKELVQKHNLSISSIGFDLGYNDLATFSKKFKIHFGSSPSHYRKTIN